MPDSQRISSAYLLLGQTLQSLSRFEEAKGYYQRIIDGYPQSIEAEQAKKYSDSLPLNQPKPEKADKTIFKPLETKPTHTEVAAEESTKSKSVERAKPDDVSKSEKSSDEKVPYFSIQVGAFSSKRNAEKLADRLRGKGYSVYIIVSSSDKKTLHKVRVGKFKNRNSAWKTERKLKRKEKLPTDVIYESGDSD
jgi:cell division septation protein DedD